MTAVFAVDSTTLIETSRLKVTGFKGLSTTCPTERKIKIYRLIVNYTLRKTVYNPV